MLPEKLEDDAAGGVLAVTWPDGRIDRHRHEDLRRACKCAECEALRRQGRAAQADEGIGIVALDFVGNYALRIGFSDGHARGIYPWETLRMLAPPATAGEA